MTEISQPVSPTLTSRNVCGSCPQPKPASWCQGCPREHAIGSAVCHFVDARATKPADIIIIAEAPVVPRISDVRKIHTAFSDDGGNVVKKAVEAIQQLSPEFANVKVHYTYAALCTGLDPNKETLDRCRGFLYGTLNKATADKNKAPIVIAMGVGAIKSLGVKAKSLKEIQGRILPGVEVNGITHTVLPTMSMKMLVAKAGLYNTFVNDLRRAFEMSTQGVPVSVPLEVLTKDYVIPKTVADVKSVCDLIVNYADEGKLPGAWSISVDTETNTKFPHRASTKILAISFAWATGRATCIPLWHKDTPYDPRLVVPYVLQVLGSAKPKILHNGKYDLKVFMFLKWIMENYVWDTMLGEHGLEEDKKGQYGLKQLTRVMHPEFAAYADNLHEMLTKLEGDSQLDNIRKAAATAEAEAAASEELASPVKKSKKKKKGEESGGFENIPLDELLLYGAVDADMTRRIAVGQIRRIAEEETALQRSKKDPLLMRDTRREFPIPHLCKHPQPVKSVVTGIAVPVSKVLARMEYDGVRVDRPYVADLYEKLGTVIENAEKDLYKLAGKDIKLNHAGAIANLLFSEGFTHPDTGQRTFYPPETMTKHNQFQTTEKVLQVLVKKYKCPFSAKKLIYAKAYKARNTFLKNVQDLSILDGRLHTNYNIHGTGTGRLSSNDENMQNIPKKLSGYSIKKLFIPSDDSMAFVNADAKGAEIRIFTAYSKDAELIRSINDGMDTHCFFAAKIVEAVRMEDGADEVLKEMGLDNSQALTYDDFASRDAIKQINKAYGEMLDKFRTAVKRVVFGILYGAGPAKIAETIGISKTQAQAIIDLLFRMFPSIPKYMASTRWELKQFGTVETYFGRRRRFAMKGVGGMLRSRAERQAVNFKIQSTSSDIVLGRLVDVATPLERDLQGRLLITVHDSIAFELPKKYLTQLPDFIEEYLVKRAGLAHPWLPVEFKWDFEVGNSYGELMPYDAFMKGITTKEEKLDELEEAYDEEEVRTDLSSLEAT